MNWTFKKKLNNPDYTQFKDKYIIKQFDLEVYWYQEKQKQQLGEYLTFFFSRPVLNNEYTLKPGRNENTKFQSKNVLIDWKAFCYLKFLSSLFYQLCQL